MSGGFAGFQGGGKTRAARKQRPPLILLRIRAVLRLRAFSAPRRSFFPAHSRLVRTISGMMAISSRQPTQMERTFHSVESQALANAPTAKEPMIIR